MWTCFRNTDQRHHCERTIAADQLKNQPENIVGIYNCILEAVQKFRPFSVSPIKDYIMLKNRSIPDDQATKEIPGYIFFSS